MQTLSTGYPELDRLIGQRVRAPGTQEVSRQGVWTRPLPGAPVIHAVLGFPVGKISVIEGPEVPAGWAAQLGAGQWDGQDVRGLLPAFMAHDLVFAQCPALTGPDPWLPKIAAFLAHWDKTLVLHVTGEIPRPLAYYAYLRLRFADGQVSITKNGFSGRSGSMPWPPPPDWTPPGVEQSPEWWAGVEAFAKAVSATSDEYGEEPEESICRLSDLLNAVHRREDPALWVKYAAPPTDDSDSEDEPDES